jgi:hypothetical protein
MVVNNASINSMSAVDSRAAMAPTFRVPMKCPTCKPTAGLDQQMEIDMQQEKVTDKK